MIADDRHDLRMPVVGATAWLTGIGTYLAGDSAPWLFGVLVLAGSAGWLTRGRFRPATGRLVVAALLVAAAVLTSTLLRHQHTATSPLAELAAERAGVTAIATAVTDPRVLEGEWGDRVVLRLRMREVTARGTTYRLGASVLALAPATWRGLEVGEQVRVSGRLRPPQDDPDLAAVLTARGDPHRIRAPDMWWRGAEAVRASIRQAVADRPDAQRSLVPALVVGDVSAMEPSLEDDFRTTGLTHLTAVSGTNLTLLLGFVLLLARLAGVRGRWLHLVALLGVVGFILLTRTEPSVLRAAAMGVVGLFALGTDGRKRGMRALGVAVTGLLLIAPSLAVSVGFALSVLATSGIVLFGPPIARALAQWLPMVAAQAIAVPLAAQVAVTPVIAAISGEVSLVAVIANVLVAPAVGPATVLGLAGGLLGLLAPALGGFCGTLAGWCVAWIVAVAQWGAQLPQASVGWGSGQVAIAALVVLCVGVIAVTPRIAGRPELSVLMASVLVLIVLDVPGRALPWPGRWPPDWVLVACDVGQGDALVLRTGPGAAIVVDAGPDPDAVDGCLDRLEVDRVVLVVLSHFHADHVVGLPGVLRGRSVEAVEVSALLDPPAAVREVEEAAAGAGVPVAVAPYGVTRQYGDATVQVLWPDLAEATGGPGDGSTANDASVVLLVEIRGVRILLTGDIEPLSQARLARLVPELEVDVLKVPHHGSRMQDLDWLGSLGAGVMVVSAGEDNDYGHPSPELMTALEDAGAVVGRTDRDGDVAVVVDAEGRPGIVTRE